MYYQGENIQINITSDSNVDLRNKNFKVLVYPHYEKENESLVKVLEKSDNIGVVEDWDNDKTTFSFNIPYEETKDMSIGDYDLEILLEYEKVGFRSIFQKTFAFSLGFSASKNY
jgi:uncharacterized protein (UPF0128 family)